MCESWGGSWEQGGEQKGKGSMGQRKGLKIMGVRGSKPGLEIMERPTRNEMSKGYYSS
jgi:hypothetical protein